MRRLRLPLAVVVLLSLIVPIQVARPSAAIAATCTNSTDWSIGVSTEPGRCINGFTFATRRRLLPPCLSPQTVQRIYFRDECSLNGGPEAIAQARAIRYLSDHLEGGNANNLTGISPNVQWEMTLPGGLRPDIFVYDRDNPAAGVDVIEAKVKHENRKYSTWSAQVNGYIAYFTSLGMANVRRGNTLNNWGPYLDEFQVWDKNQTCKTADGNPGYFRRTYVATSPTPGLLDVEEKASALECDRDRVQAPTSSPPVAAIPDTIPADEVDTLPAADSVAEDLPLADEVAAMGGPELAADSLAAEIEAYLGTSAGAAFLAEAGFASVGAVLALGGAAAVALIVWYLLSHYGGQFSGDPHMTTVDGLHYDMQAAGEFVLAESDKWGFEIQGRQEPLTSGSNVSVLNRVAMDVGQYRVEFDNSGHLYIDGQATTLAAGRILYLGEDSYIVRAANGQYAVLWAGVGGPVFSWNGFSSAQLWMPPDAASDLRGLFGNANGNPQDDLALSDGTPVAANSSATVLDGVFADSWRITDAESLFTYAAGQDTSTFTDLTFPPSVETIHDLTGDQITLASAQCAAADVPAGPQFTSCILDVALSADTTFATEAAQQRSVVIDPNAAGVDATGNLSVDFESSSLPTNLTPARLSTDPATTAFAGPFTDNDTYRFYVQSLPAYSGGTLSFDLLALGDWTSGTDAKSVTIQTNRANPVTLTPTSMTPTATGTLGTGVTFTKYRVTVPVSATTSQLEYTISASGVTGVAGLAFGVDNVQLQLQLVPPQLFNVTVPATVSNGVPAAGAGDLETGVSEDDYQFTATSGESLYLAMQSCPGSSSSNLRWRLLSGSNIVVASSYACAGGPIRGLAAGTYRLVFTSPNGTAGTYAFQLAAIPADAQATVTSDGKASTVTTTTPWQNAQWSLAGTAGQKLSFGFSGGGFGSIINAQVSVLNPDGTTLISPVYCGTSCNLPTTTLPSTGSYTVRLTSSGGTYGAMTLNVSPNVTTTASTNGTASTLTTTVPGQVGVWSFAGTAGQALSFGFSGGGFGSIINAQVTVLNPDGTTLIRPTYCGTSCVIGTTTLPATGTYTVVLSPTANTFGPLTMSAASNVTASVPTDGTSSTITTTAVGQVGVWSFAGTAGQALSFGFSGGGFGSIINAQVTVVEPDGSVLAGPFYCGTSCDIATQTLPLTGTYLIRLTPTSSTFGALTVNVSPNVTAAATTDGTASTLTTTVPGQVGTWTFAGTAGQAVSFGFTGGGFGSIINAQVTVLNPDGTTLVSPVYCGTSCDVGTTTLPTTGTYTIGLIPTSTTFGAMTAHISGLVSATASTDGTASTLTTTAPGQIGAWTFTGTAGQTLSFGFTGGGFGSSINAQVTVLKPDGTTLVSPVYCGSSCDIGLTALPTTGTYTIRLIPTSTTYGSLTAHISAPVTTTATTNGTASTLTTTAPGQLGVWTFAGTAGQTLSFGFTGGGFGSSINAQVSVLNPDGTTLVSATYCGSSCDIGLTALPTTGTYTIRLIPTSTTYGSLTAHISAPVTTTATTNGTASTLTTTAPGQLGVWTFAGTAGQALSYGFTGGGFGSSINAQVTILKPDGTTLVSPTYCGSSCDIGLTTLPTTGTYTIRLIPTSTTFGAMTVHISAPVTTTATTNGTASTLTTTVAGQVGLWSFPGTAGTSLTFTFTNGGFGSSINAQVTVLKPDGTTLVSPTYCGTSCSISATAITVTGTYTIKLIPTSTTFGALTVSIRTS